ncbi:MAG: hypothetical protein R3E97_10350 [Candidatus Eisenbacteria bacterium]
MADHYLNGENGNGHGEDTRDVSLRDFLSVLFRRKGIVATVFLAAVLVVILLNARSEVLYESSSTIRVSRGEKESAFNSRIMLLTWEEELNSEIETIMSQQIVELAQERLEEEGARDSNGLPIKLAAKNVRASTSGKSAVVYISYKHEDPKAARIGCSAITQAYGDFRLRVRAVPQVDAFFREEIENLREQLDEWEQERAKFMNEESVVKIPDERLNLLDVRKTTEVDLARVGPRSPRPRRSPRSSGIASWVAGPMSSTSMPSPTETIATIEFSTGCGPNWWLSRRRSSAAESQYSDHPEVRAWRPRPAAGGRDPDRDAARAISHLEARTGARGAERRAPQDSLRGRRRALEPAGEGSPLGRIRSGPPSSSRPTTQRSWTKQIQARIEQAAVPTGTSDPEAGCVRLPIRVNDYVRLAVIPILSLILGVTLAFLIDGLDHTLKDSTEVENHLRLPVLGSVGRIR